MLNDMQIRDAVTSRLEFDSRIDSSQVAIEVSGGHVQLRGSIPSLTQKRELSLIVWAINSVKTVSNQLEISSTTGEGSLPDPEIKSNVKTAIKINSETSQVDPQISVDDNVVTISGAVDSLEKAKKVESIISDLTGVKDVINLLTVVPTKIVSDEIIAKAIVESFKQNTEVNEAVLDVIVERGKVTLQGKVLSAKTATQAYDCASRVIGVKDINNEIIWD